LSRERILAAASELIERVGLGEFSMRGLGAELGVEAMSLYHHFPSKAHLCDALLDDLLSRSPDVDETLPFRERIRQLLLNYRAAIHRCPAFAQFALTHRMNTRAGLAYLERAVVPFRDAGFSAEEGARAFRSLAYYVMGAISDETSGYARGPTAQEAVPAEEEQRIAPTLASFGPFFQQEEWDKIFEFGLEALLDRIEALHSAKCGGR
jgi:AcrR family transcriptional regulator